MSNFEKIFHLEKISHFQKISQFEKKNLNLKKISHILESIFYCRQTRAKMADANGKTEEDVSKTIIHLIGSEL